MRKRGGKEEGKEGADRGIEMCGKQEV